MEIKTAVGRGGTVKGSDVGIIQELINQQFRLNAAYKAALTKHIDLHMPPRQALKVDNDCGDKTITAIEQFQLVVLKWQTADGRVDKDGTTFKALNGNVSNAKHIVKKSGRYVRLSQWDYPKTLIGKSSSYSIRQIGCTLTTLTMAATAIGSKTKHWPDNLLPKDLTPVKANDILKKSGAFTNGGEMVVKNGAKALGMKYEEYGRDSNLTSQDLTRLKTHLGKGNPVAAHVDYRDKEKVDDDLGDHWILITQGNADGSFTAIDPMFGGEITLKTTSNKNSRYKGERAKQKPGVLFGNKGNQHKAAGPKTRANQQKYIVVRFGLLSPMQDQSQAKSSLPQMCYVVEEPKITLNLGYGGFTLESLGPVY